MNLTEIKKVKVPRKKKFRVGRGVGSGLGKTCGKGMKGQKSRSGVSFKATSEGGTMPLVRRLPKRGFTNPCRTEYIPINLNALNKAQTDKILDPAKMKEIGLIKNLKKPVKILGTGELTQPLNIKAHKFSKTAQEKIQKAGGSFEVI